MYDSEKNMNFFSTTVKKLVDSLVEMAFHERMAKSNGMISP